MRFLRAANFTSRETVKQFVTLSEWEEKSGTVIKTHTLPADTHENTHWRCAASAGAPAEREIELKIKMKAGRRDGGRRAGGATRRRTHVGPLPNLFHVGSCVESWVRGPERDEAITLTG